MSSIRVVPVGNPEPPLLDAVCDELARAFDVACSVVDSRFDAAFAHHPERNQYFSTPIVERLAATSAGELVVGITELDLYIPILTFVFGEAQLGGTSALVSYHRLRQEFYGLPRDPSLLCERLVKEAIHEVGHTSALTHCDDYDCVMAATHAVEWIDLKSASFCAACRRSVGAERRRLASS
ncbi:MAG TPA: archaemetzincin family Zn-dependent metalloprotease [Thermoanaerobaculia bacterium]|nr:archaemetzincin family Zn-dependent metalloprotease [Thermoanaerobaculia bacterium]